MKHLTLTVVTAAVTLAGLGYSETANGAPPEKPAETQPERLAPPPTESARPAAPVTSQHTEAVSKAPSLTQRANGVLGMEIRNADPTRLGKLDDIVFDLDSGKIAYAVMTRGGVMGIGAKQWAVPLSALRPSEDTRCLVLATTLERLESTPGLRRGEWPGVENPAWGAETFWKTPPEASPPPQQPASNPDPSKVEKPPGTGAGLERPNSDAKASSPNAHQPTKLNFVKRVCGIEVKDPQGTRLGSVADLVLDWEGEKIAYTVFALSGSESDFWGRKLIAIPITAYHADAKGDALVLRSTAEKLEAAPALGKDNWPSVTHPRWTSDGAWEEASAAPSRK